MSWTNTKDWQFHFSAGLRPSILMTRLFWKPYSTTSSSNSFDNQHRNLIHRSRGDFSPISWHIAIYCHILPYIAISFKCIMHRLPMRLPPCTPCAVWRGVASMVVDGQRSLEQVESELRQKLLISQDWAHLGEFSHGSGGKWLLNNTCERDCE